MRSISSVPEFFEGSGRRWRAEQMPPWPIVSTGCAVLQHHPSRGSEDKWHFLTFYPKRPQCHSLVWKAICKACRLALAIKKKKKKNKNQKLSSFSKEKMFIGCSSCGSMILKLFLWAWGRDWVSPGTGSRLSVSCVFSHRFSLTSALCVETRLEIGYTNVGKG